MRYSILKELTILSNLHEDHSYSLLTKHKKKKPKNLAINKLRRKSTGSNNGKAKGNKTNVSKDSEMLQDSMLTKLDHSTCFITIRDKDFENINNSSTCEEHPISPPDENTSVWEDIFPTTEHVQKDPKSVRRSRRSRTVSQKFRESWMFSETDEEELEPVPRVRCCPKLKPHHLLNPLKSET